MTSLQMIKIAIMCSIIIAVSSCSFNIKGNYLTLVPTMSSSNNTPLDERGLVDENGTPVLRLASIYFSSKGGKEYITLAYNNKKSETLEVSSKSMDKDGVLYILGNKHTLAIGKTADKYHVTFMSNFHTKDRKTKDGGTISRYTEFASVSSIKTISKK